MQEPALKFPVTCPECALESLFELPIALIANALLTGKGIRLHAHCHEQYWTATFVERDQLRKHLSALKIQTRQDEGRSSESLALAMGAIERATHPACPAE